MSCVESNPLLLVGNIQNTGSLPIRSQSWTQISGPTAFLVTPGAVSTYAVLPEPGTYVFRFCVTYVYPGVYLPDGSEATLSACDDTTVVSVGCPGPRILHAQALSFPSDPVDLSALFVEAKVGDNNSEGRWRLRDSTNTYQLDVTIQPDGTLDSGTASAYWDPITHILTPNNVAADTLLLEVGCVTEDGTVEYATTGTPVFGGGDDNGDPDPEIPAPPAITLARVEGEVTQRSLQAVQSVTADTQVLCYIDGGMPAGFQTLFTNAYATLRAELKARVWNGNEASTASHFRVFTVTNWDRSYCFRYLSYPQSRIAGTGPYPNQLSIYGVLGTPYVPFTFQLEYLFTYKPNAFDGRIRRMHAVTTDTNIRKIYNGTDGFAPYPPNKSDAPNTLFTVSIIPGSAAQAEVTRGVLAAVGLDGTV